MKIVLDTNVLVSGLLQPFGPYGPHRKFDYVFWVPRLGSATPLLIFLSFEETPRRGGHLNSPAAPAPGTRVDSIREPRRGDTRTPEMPPLQGYRCLLGRRFPGLAPPGYSNGLPFGASSSTTLPLCRGGSRCFKPLGHSRLSRATGASEYVILITERSTKLLGFRSLPLRRAGSKPAALSTEARP